MNECRLNAQPCPSHHRCINTRGGHLCRLVEKNHAAKTNDVAKINNTRSKGIASNANLTTIFGEEFNSANGTNAVDTDKTIYTNRLLSAHEAYFKFTASQNQRTPTNRQDLATISSKSRTISENLNLTDSKDWVSRQKLNLTVVNRDRIKFLQDRTRYTLDLANSFLNNRKVLQNDDAAQDGSTSRYAGLSRNNDYYQYSNVIADNSTNKIFAKFTHNDNAPLRSPEYLIGVKIPIKNSTHLQVITIAKCITNNVNIISHKHICCTT